MDKIESLIERNNALIQKMEERDAIYARALQMKQKAEVPDGELQKIRETIESAKCGLPDTLEMEKKITEGVTGGIRRSLSEEIRDAVRNEYVPSECVGTLKTKLTIYRVVSSIFVLLCVIGVLWYRNGEHYWGRQYLEVAESTYLTEDESETLRKNVDILEVLPKEYKTTPAHVKEKIRQNKAILKARRKEDKTNKGTNLSTRVPIER